MQRFSKACIKSVSAVAPLGKSASIRRARSCCSSPEADPRPDLALHAAEERMLRCLGSAVILQWNELPTEIQRKLFEDAASMTDSARQFELKQQIARFLHKHKDDAGPDRGLPKG
jgi:hypothetical protein